MSTPIWPYTLTVVSLAVARTSGVTPTLSQTTTLIVRDGPASVPAAGAHGMAITLNAATVCAHRPMPPPQCRRPWRLESIGGFARQRVAWHQTIDTDGGRAWRDTPA